MEIQLALHYLVSKFKNGLSAFSAIDKELFECLISKGTDVYKKDIHGNSAFIMCVLGIITMGKLFDLFDYFMAKVDIESNDLKKALGLLNGIKLSNIQDETLKNQVISAINNIQSKQL